MNAPSYPSPPEAGSPPENPTTELVSELLLLPDGTMLAHHLTPTLAEALAHILLPQGTPNDTQPHVALRQFSIPTPLP